MAIFLAGGRFVTTSTGPGSQTQYNVLGSANYRLTSLVMSLPLVFSSIPPASLFAFSLIRNGNTGLLLFNGEYASTGAAGTSTFNNLYQTIPLNIIIPVASSIQWNMLSNGPAGDLIISTLALYGDLIQ